ncbi:MAG: hypothetical protein B7Y25_04010 [Alphaproteobacteria bacterium 16-39-46]|nr:MAG: hypothetical protein B7Y25_04010 [Alphaproteobacteria bacterium 16-39-46]OZA43098.1 MAG: hypothetical protein B7X84_04145 [Alphaproteobacteria bacterium 17-39-52]HQS84333.1 type VI secretion system protein TssA [Alphaproteobacteria bacterium]HQS93940.1 type VI secretion system protein TssA [Alphaproteobacteria bacterium]
MSLKKTTSLKKNLKREDRDPILVPLAGTKPAGEFLAYDPIYNKIRLARQEDDPSLPQGVWKKSLKVSDFKEVEKITTEALSTRSKDFQLMVWLIEAWVKLYQLQGLIRGLKLLNALCLTFWETGYPPLKRGDNDYRLAPFHWLNEKLSARISEIFISETSLSEPISYRFLDWKEALSLEKTFQKSDDPETSEKKAQDEGRPILKNLQRAISDTSSAFYQALAQNLETALQEIETLEKFLLTHYQSSEVSLYQLRRNVNDILDLIHQIDAERGEISSQEKIIQKEVQSIPSSPSSEDTLQKDLRKPQALQESESTPISKEESPVPKPTNSSSTAFQSREEAYTLLQQIQTYLMDTEPHSPAPYLIKRALKWEHMSLEDVFREVLDETGDLNQLLTLLGMQKTPHSPISE